MALTKVAIPLCLLWLSGAGVAQELASVFATLQGAKPEMLIAALECPDVYTREIALAQIAREDRSPELTRAAAAAVATMRCSRVKAQLIAVLAERGDGSALPAVRAALKDADASVRTAAVQACGLLKDVQAVEALFELLGGEQSEVAREALRRIPNPVIDERFVDLLKNGAGSNRVMAVELLAARRYSGLFDLALDKGLFEAGDPAQARVAAGAIRTYAPAGGFERVLAFALTLPAPSSELLAGTLSATLDEASDRAACERRVGAALGSCGAGHAALLTGLLAASQGAEALEVLSKRAEAADLDIRKDALRNLGKWNREAALVPLVLAAKRERDPGAQTLAWRSVLDIVKRADRVVDFYQAVAAIQQAVWYAPRREEKLAALAALPLYHPKAWEVEWLLTKIEAELPDMAEEAGRVKDALVPPFSGQLGR